MLEQAKDKHIVAPGINWLIATLHDAEAVGIPASWLHKLMKAVRLHSRKGRAGRV